MFMGSSDNEYCGGHLRLISKKAGGSGLERSEIQSICYDEENDLNIPCEEAG